MAKKTWVEKRDKICEPVIEIADKKFGDIAVGSRMLIATPAMVDAAVKTIAKGSQTNLAALRKQLAEQNGAESCCPLTAGIFLRISAEAAWEELQQGMPETKVAPFWRAIPLKSTTAKKLSFGTEYLQSKRWEEGLEG